MFQEKRIRLAIIFSFILPLLIYSGCKKDDPVDPVDTPPTARTVSATIIGQNWASLRGEVDANGISTDITFEYDTTDTFENSITTEPPTIESDRTVTISTGIKGLLPAKKPPRHPKQGSDTVASHN